MLCILKLDVHANSYKQMNENKGYYFLRLTQNTQSESYELVDFIEKSNKNLGGPEDKFGFNKTLWTPEESSRANGKKLKWLPFLKTRSLERFSTRALVPIAVRKRGKDSRVYTKDRFLNAQEERDWLKLT